ncbi:MAG: hypothetical protein GX122_01630 [Candidatus Cloacimonetes bacterium]|nr:hypothetical protein [Candidatus Cloacimonadota bacterium]NLO11108.1 hypothetical protein [Candidatus Cloacimonadota bacterium]
MSANTLLKWRSWPLVDRGKTSIILIVFLILLAVLLWHITVNVWETPFYYYLGMLLVLANLMPWFIPTDYELGEYEIKVRYLFITVRRKYTDFGCYYEDKHGIMLSTFKMPRRLDPFRGQSLRFSANREEVEELNNILHKKIGKKY